MTQNVVAHEPALACTGLLVEPKVNAAIDARVVDVVGDLLERRLLQHDVRHEVGDRSRPLGGRIRQRIGRDAVAADWP